MSFSDRTMTEPYTSREVSTVPGEGDANLLLQDSKAAAPYSTKRKRYAAAMTWILSRPTLPRLAAKRKTSYRTCRAGMKECSS